MNRKRKMNESSTTFIFKFDGESDFDARKLADSIQLLTDTLCCITDAYDDGAYLKVKISALSPGSFMIDFNILISSALTLLNNTGITNAIDIVKVLISTFQIKRHLNGNPPLSITENKDSTVIKNISGSTLNVTNNYYKIYTDHPMIDKNESEIAKIAHSEGRTGIEFRSEDGGACFTPEDISKISKPIDLGVKKNTKIDIINVDLLLKQPDLIGESKWGFSFFSHTINAKIEDQDFLDNVHNRKIKALYAGVRIPSELNIITELDKFGNPIEKSEHYVISKVTGPPIEPKSEGEQLGLFDED